MAKYKISKKTGQCDWEEWNPKTKEMELEKCLKETNIKKGNKFVCREHFDYVLSMDSKPEFYQKNGAELPDKTFFLLKAGAS